MIRIANAPCSWGVLEFDLDGQAAGYQQVLDEIKQTGYVGTELGDWGFMPTDPTVLKDELLRRELSMLAAFVPVALRYPEKVDAGIETVLRTARLLSVVSDSPFIVLADENGTDPVRVKHAGRIQPEHGLTEAQWHMVAGNAERLARTVLEETGVKTVFHHHCAGFVETPEEVDTFLSLTNPLLIGLCFDTGHYAFGDGDPVAGFKRHANRIWHVHFKDYDPAVAAQSRENDWDYFESVKRGIFPELGKGNVDFAAIVSELNARNYSGWVVVEQDVLPGMGTPLESARSNRRFLASLGL